MDYQRKNPMSYRFVDDIYAWLDDDPNLAVTTKRTREGIVRGYFIANRVPLPKDKHRFHSNKNPVSAELSVDEFRKILSSCNLTYRAAFLVMFQSGSGVGELLHINEKLAARVWGEVRRGTRIIRLAMPGRKQNKNLHPYYTFIGGDAVEALKHLFHSMGWRQDGVLFRTEYGQPISATSLQRYFQSHAFKVGVIKRKTYPCLDCGGETVRQRRGKRDDKKIHYVCTACQSDHLASDYGANFSVRGGIRYRMKTHELRDLFRTEFHRAQTYAGADADVGEFCMGHSVDPLKYDKVMRDVSYTRGEYRKALPFLNILSEEPRKVDRREVEAETRELRREVEELRRQCDEFDVIRANLPLLKDAVKLLREKRRRLE